MPFFFQVPSEVDWLGWLVGLVGLVGWLVGWVIYV